MQLILTHENSDFDAVASQLAAYKLYPEATPLLSRYLNNNVKQFLSLYWSSLPFQYPEDWKRQQVKEVLLVDTQTLSSVRGIKKSVVVHVIDHHTPDTTPAKWQTHIDSVGATVTLLVEMLQMTGLTLTAEEATLMLLGIYEDTGLLTYDTTTSRDAQAAAWLIGQQARLPDIRRFLKVRLTPEQDQLYEQLEENIESLTIEGQRIILATAQALPTFADEISTVVHALRDNIEGDALLVLVQMPKHIQLVARSMTEQVDVGTIARRFGGGGHSRASAARLKGVSLSKALSDMYGFLPQAVQPATRVSAIMSQGVQTVPAFEPIREAAIKVQRWGHEGYPVVNKEGQVVGLLTRRNVDRALNHGLGDKKVHHIMRAGNIHVIPHDSVSKVQRLILEEGWGQIPVLHPDTQQLIGIVTRTDLLNLWAEKETSQPRQLQDKMAAILPPATWQLIKAVSAVAADMNYPLYFVGGIVRDLLLDQAPTDIDMVVEGDAIALAQTLQERYGGDSYFHGRFGTAKWITPVVVWQKIAPHTVSDNLPDSIDFVTARTEFYVQPTALPEVEKASIKLDLHRRDFTINTLAIRLDGAHLGQLLDFYSGQRDLAQGVLRVLHSLSFVDDPTRILRAVRFEQRLQFKIDPRTAELIDNNLTLLTSVTGDRIRHEIELSLREQCRVSILKRLDEMGVLAQLHPDFGWQADIAESFEQVPALLEHPLWQTELKTVDETVIYFVLWLLPFPTEIQTAVLQRLRARKTTKADVTATAKLLHILPSLIQAPPSQCVLHIRPYANRSHVLAIATAYLFAQNRQKEAHILQQYQETWQHITPALNGHDLIKLGVSQGPQVGEWLQQLLVERLDGHIHSKEDEEVWVQQKQQQI